MLGCTDAVKSIHHFAVVAATVTIRTTVFTQSKTTCGKKRELMLKGIAWCSIIVAIIIIVLIHYIALPIDVAISLKAVARQFGA